MALDKIGTCPILGIYLHKPDTNYTQMETYLCDDPKTVFETEVIFVVRGEGEEDELFVLSCELLVGDLTMRR